MPDRVERAAGGPVVVRDLAGVHLVREADALGVEDVEDRVPPVGEVLVAALDHRVGHRREHRDGVPDRGAGEADHGVDAEPGGRPRGVLHPLGGPLPYLLGVAVAPDRGGQDALVPLVDRVVADGLADQVVGDREDLQVVLRELLALAVEVVALGQRPVDLEVVAPAGDLQAVVAPLGGEPADLLERQVGPLAGEERNGSGHVISLSAAASVATAQRGSVWPA